MTAKAQLTERRRGKGGTLVTVRGKSGVFVVKDLMNRKSYDRPDRIGVGRETDGLAIGVPLSDVEIYFADERCAVCGEESASAGSMRGYVHRYGPVAHGPYVSSNAE
jgi:hypothetical protein